MEQELFLKGDHVVLNFKEKKYVAIFHSYNGVDEKFCFVEFLGQLYMFKVSNTKLFNVNL